MLIFYCICVVGIYAFSIAPLFSYSFLTLNINYTKLAVSILILSVTIMMLPKDRDKPSTYLFYILYIIMFIPTLSFYWLNDQATQYIIYLFLCFALIEYLIKKKKRGIRIHIPQGLRIFKLAFVIYCILNVTLFIRNGGINKNTLRLDLISANRENELTGIWGYILNWNAKAFCPMFFAFFFYKKKWFFVVLTFFLQAMLYLSFGFKAFLFSIVLLLLIAYIINNFHKQYFKILPLFLGMGIILCYMFDKLGISRTPLFTLPYRTLFIPAQGQFQYYDYFTQYDFLYFSEGIIGRILGISYPYDLPIGMVVNKYIYGLQNMSNGNTGVFSYGYADMGLFGMLFSSFILVVLFWIIDGSTRKVPISIVVPAMAYQMIIMNDVNILISINTGGILWTIMLLLVFNSVFSCDEKGFRSWIERKMFS